MITFERDSVTRAHLQLPERDDHFVLYGDVTHCHDAVHAALAHDEHVRIHLLHVNRLAFRWSSRLGLSDDDRSLFTVAALLHDCGKSKVPSHIVGKPSQLDDDEWDIMRQHVAWGCEIVESSGGGEIAKIIYQHHERLDGRGYPEGIVGSTIHPIARMLSVIDAFSAMVDDRPYRVGMPETRALAILQEHAGTQFDPEYVESFVTMRHERAVDVVTSAGSRERISA